VFDIDRERCIAAGMDGFLTKPIQIEPLLDLLKQLPDQNQRGFPENQTAGISFPVQENRLTSSSRMQDLQDGLGDGLSDVIETYLSDVPRLINEMKHNLTLGNLGEISRIAHSMKSSSGIFGAQHVMELCKDIEIHARRGNNMTIDNIIAVEDAFEDLRKELASYIANR
jgi:HPt (histidine-containing phosphotransfer) domain-containing protein